VQKRCRVGVIYGGRSGEHEVSLVSAASVMRAIDRERFDVVPIAIDKNGRWLRAQFDGTQAVATGEPVALLTDPTNPRLVSLAGERVEQIDIFFPVLHGTFGEDGTLQGLLEMAGVPYVGAGVLASAAGMDKGIMKALFAQAGLPQVPYQVLLRSEWERSPAKIVQRLEGTLAYPMFVKPANLGSSVGVSKALDRAQLNVAIAKAAAYDRRLIVEQGVVAREIECSVLGNDEPCASIPGEIVPCNEFYDYRAKYVDTGSELLIPAPLADDVVAEVQKLAIKAFRAIDCSGMARVDFFLEKDSGRVLVNEINTIPGFTAISMYPKLWEASGLSYRDLLTRLLTLGWERFQDRSRLRTSYN
jgi:D-alanine-D-alanine ligase